MGAGDTTALRPGHASDLAALLAIETEGFSSDRLSRRSLRHFLTSPKASVLVAEAGEQVAGYALVMFRDRSPVARLYSIIVAAEFAGRGLGRRLLAAAEDAALARGCALMRLEVDERNEWATGVYRRAGYQAFGRRPGYYQDGGTALRFEKRLAPAAPGISA